MSPEKGTRGGVSGWQWESTAGSPWPVQALVVQWVLASEAKEPDTPGVDPKAWPAGALPVHCPETTVARASGVALREREGQLLFIHLNTGWTYTVGFVLGLIAVILGLNGLGQLVMGVLGKGYPLIGAALLAVGGGAGLLLWRVVRYARSQLRRPSNELEVLVIVDLATHTLRDPNGNPLAPLSTVRFRRRLQLTSSAPSLAVEWPGGFRLLVKGNAFAGGTHAFEAALRARGFVIG